MSLFSRVNVDKTNYAFHSIVMNLLNNVTTKEEQRYITKGKEIQNQTALFLLWLYMCSRVLRVGRE